MKIIIAALTAAAALSGLTATAVQAQPYGPPPPGYYHRHHGWRHYAAPPHRVCFWRYGHRVCRWVR